MKATFYQRTVETTVDGVTTTKLVDFFRFDFEDNVRLHDGAATEDDKRNYPLQWGTYQNALAAAAEPKDEATEAVALEDPAEIEALRKLASLKGDSAGGQA